MTILKKIGLLKKGLDEGSLHNYELLPNPGFVCVKSGRGRQQNWRVLSRLGIRDCNLTENI